MSDTRLLAFAKRLRAVRKIKGISQEKLAALSGTERAYMGKIERGESSPTLSKVFDIVEALDININELFD